MHTLEVHHGRGQLRFGEGAECSNAQLAFGFPVAVAGKVLHIFRQFQQLPGPEVIETANGVEEFDSRDRALVYDQALSGGFIVSGLMADACYALPDATPADRRAALGAARGGRKLAMPVAEAVIGDVQALAT